MTVATYFSTQMAALTGNTGGAVQTLPTVSQIGGRERIQVANLALASQTSGSAIMLARLPLGAVISGIQLITDTSLGTSTIALGDVGAGNSAIYAAAQTLTGLNTPTRVGLAATHGAMIATGYDATTGNLSKSYEDVVMTVAVANLPATGNVVVIFEYAID
jgi:hypothetical protein